MTNNFVFEADLALKKFTYRANLTRQLKKFGKHLRTLNCLQNGWRLNPGQSKNKHGTLPLAAYRNMLWLALKTRYIGCTTNLLR